MTRRRMSVLGGVLLVGSIVAVSGAIVLTRKPGSTPTASLGPPHFVEQAAAAGIDHTYDGDYPFATGGGVAAFDCNGDGKSDLYLAGGSQAAGLYRNDSPVGGTLRFSRVADPATDLPDVIGAYPLDIDGDGLVDLAVLRVGESVLLRGLGDCRFERANEAWSFSGGPAWTTAFSAKWDGTDGFPTLAIGRYLGLDAAGKPTDDCADSALVRPAPGGHRYGPPIALSPGYCTLSMLFTDWDRSGRRDLRVSNDRQYYDPVNGGEQLWRVAPGEAPRRYTEADGWVQLQLFGMGIASQDLTGDGYPEVYLTSQADNKLQTLADGPSVPTYRDIARTRGVVAAEPFTGVDYLPSTSWHDEFQDVNNDGFVDLLITKGNVNEQEGYATKDPTELLLGQPGGSFIQGAKEAGIVDYARGRGAALVDFNLDGLLDLVELPYGSPAELWRSVGGGKDGSPAGMGGWLALRLSQTGSNRDAIGSWVEVRVGDTTLRREITVGGGHLGGQLGWTHFGIGPAENVSVRVQWPDGQWGPWLDVSANEFVEIERGATETRPWQPR